MMRFPVFTAIAVCIAVASSCGAPSASGPAAPTKTEKTVETSPTTKTETTAKPPATNLRQPAPAVVGSWKATGAAFAEITIKADGTFASHMHERPFSSGKWRLTEKGGEYTLVLSSPATGDDILRGVRRDKATLVLTVDGDVVVWQPITQP